MHTQYTKSDVQDPLASKVKNVESYTIKWNQWKDQIREKYAVMRHNAYYNVW